MFVSVTSKPVKYNLSFILTENILTRITIGKNANIKGLKCGKTTTMATQNMTGWPSVVMATLTFIVNGRYKVTIAESKVPMQALMAMTNIN